MGRLAEAGETDDARQMVLQAMSQPVDIAGLAAEARDPQEAAEVYAASLMAITVDSQAERDYLARLAAALRLPPEAVAHIQAKLAGKARLGRTYPPRPHLYFCGVGTCRAADANSRKGRPRGHSCSGGGEYFPPPRPSSQKPVSRMSSARVISSAWASRLPTRAAQLACAARPPCSGVATSRSSPSVRTG